MRYVTAALEDALSERLNEILVPMTKRDDLSPAYSEVQAAIESLRHRLSDDDSLLQAFDETVSLIRSYSFDEYRACYLQGFKDHRQLLIGDLDFLSEKDE
ncbi:MAG: hypothetical protein IKK34_08840 [Clostridia bacterium]|nr:hypothetical protein [Clostridia bacterium]